MKSILLSCMVLFAATMTSAQIKTKVPPPGRTMKATTAVPAANPKDSAEFAKAFKELFPLISPAKSLTEDANDFVLRMSKSFKAQGLDSALAYKTALANIDDKASYKMFYDIYSSLFDAKDLKRLTEFLKTPEGKKVFASLPQLDRAANSTNQYISRTVNANLAPMRQEARAKMQKEHPAPPRMPVIKDSSARPTPVYKMTPPTKPGEIVPPVTDSMKQ